MKYKVDNAIIMAAGMASRFAPLSYRCPKPLLNIKGEILIERQIRQLREAGVYNIIVVVGYMKEKFSYLKDKYNVVIIENADYTVRNNHSTIFAAKAYLKNSYICSADNYFAINPFEKEVEGGAYYAAAYSRGRTDEWCLTMDDNDFIVGVTIGGRDQWYMMGHAFWTAEFSERFLRILEEEYDKEETRNKLWEAIYMEHLEELKMKIRRYGENEIFEFDSLEELSAFDKKYKLESVPEMDEITAIIMRELGIEEKEIEKITVMKKGMTNQTYLVQLKDRKYIVRIPGKGTERIINRKEEAEVYRAIHRKGICDNLVYISSRSGCKITEYFENARVCNPLDWRDVKKCMGKLKEVHEMGLRVEHEFDIFKQIDKYEHFLEKGGCSSRYKDYKQTKANIFSLKPYIDAHVENKVLTHIDAVPDNFLFIKDEKGKEGIRLIDWEYAGMQDPHVDIAMFGIYALYDRTEMEHLIQEYFMGKCEDSVRIKIYCYIAACGLLWSNWCEFKSSLGVEFGEYALRQYAYAKDYYRIIRDEWERADEKYMEDAGAERQL